LGTGVRETPALLLNRPRPAQVGPRSSERLL